MSIDEIELTEDEMQQCRDKAVNLAKSPNASQNLETIERIRVANRKQEKVRLSEAAARDERKRRANAEFREQLERRSEVTEEQVSAFNKEKAARQMRSDIMAIKDDRARRQQIFEHMNLFE